MSLTEILQMAKAESQRRIAERSDALVALSRRIHAHPEIGFEEVLASRWCADALARAGYSVAMGAAGLETAFVADLGAGECEVALCCEYDALPGVGHACGHNVIAAASVGAAVGLAAVAGDLGLRVRVVGTPAEENGGGKVLLLRAGVFDGLDAAMMVHPYPAELTSMPCLAVANWEIGYRGVAAHAAAFPERGVNAADALTVAQVAIGLLRQHAGSGEQVHGITTHGGEAPNIIAAATRARYCVRAPSLAQLESWSERVHRCFDAGALATGCEVEVRELFPAYSEFLVNDQLSALYIQNAESLGRRFADASAPRAPASTDMANVSLVVPCLHPTIDIGAGDAVNHQPEFTARCATPTADRAVIDAATALAWTALDVAAARASRRSA